jgi:hypothetical protein
MGLRFSRNGTLSRILEKHDEMYQNEMYQNGRRRSKSNVSAALDELQTEVDLLQTVMHRSTLKKTKHHYQTS